MTGEGIDSLTKRILDNLSAMRLNTSQALVVRKRQADLLREASALMSKCSRSDTLPLELRSEYLRQASHILGKLTGFVDTEALLGVIFSEFCIGK